MFFSPVELYACTMHLNQQAFAAAALDFVALFTAISSEAAAEAAEAAPPAATASVLISFLFLLLHFDLVLISIY